MPLNPPGKITTRTSRRDAVLRLLEGEGVAVVAKDAGAAPEEVLRWKNLFVRAGSVALAAESGMPASAVSVMTDAGVGDDEPALDWGWEEQQLGWMVTQLSELLSEEEPRRRL
jgi:hypothetical protein